MDVNALTWLEEFLNAWKKTVIIVSHDRGFLNAVTTNIVFLHHKKLKYYGGNYDTFVKVWENLGVLLKLPLYSLGLKEREIFNFFLGGGGGGKMTGFGNSGSV